MNQKLHSEKQIDDIRGILLQMLRPKRIYLFGSRASGTNKEYSDFDIAIEGNKGTFRDIRRTKQKIDEALGIYSCDLTELEKVSRDFEELIREKGKIIYERD